MKFPGYVRQRKIEKLLELFQIITLSQELFIQICEIPFQNCFMLLKLSMAKACDFVRFIF